MTHQAEHEAPAPGIVQWLMERRKIIAFIIGVAITAAVYTWGTDNPWVSFAVLVGTGVGIYGVPNASKGKKEPTAVG